MTATAASPSRTPIVAGQILMRIEPDSDTPRELADRINVVREHMVAGRKDQTLYALGKIPARYAEHPEVLTVKGLIELKMDRFEPALRLLRRAYQLKPLSEGILMELVVSLWQCGQREEAIATAQRHHERHPTHQMPLRLLSDLFQKLNYGPTARSYARKLLELIPDSVDAVFINAYARSDLRQYDDAIGFFRRAMELAPQQHRTAEALAFTMLYAGSDPMEIRRHVESVQARHFASTPRLPDRKPLSHGGKLRVGYLSGDFRRHVVRQFFEGVLREHDRSRVEVTCYSSVEKEDEVTARLRSFVPTWRAVHRLTDADVASLIHADGIDVLVDLGGLTDSSRAAVVMRRPAPVQVTYLGYPATTGFSEMDYRITDALADPPGVTDAYHTEKLHRLPRCAWAYEQDEVPGIETSKAALDTVGTFTFGSFNLLTKVNQATTNLWGRVLAACPGKARLLMTDRKGLLGDPEGVEILRREFTDAGADARHILLASWVPDPFVQRRRLNEVDVMLDPLSYNGTTTTCEAALCGVPTLTLPGNAHVSRVGLSLLTALGLQDQFVARDESDFIAKAVHLAENPDLIRELRPTLRDRFKASPLADFESLARALEDAYFHFVHEKTGVSA